MKSVSVYYHIFIFYLLLILILPLTGQSRYGGASMQLGLGAQNLALGGATVARVGQHDGFYYNPSAPAGTDRLRLSLMYAPSFGGFGKALANYNYVGVSLPLPQQAVLGVHWTRFSVDDIPLFPSLRGSSYADRLNNAELRPDGTPSGSFTDIEDVFYFNFSRMFSVNLALGWLFTDLPVKVPVGFTIKGLRQRIYDSSASGLGLDIGTMIKFKLGHLLDRRTIGDVAIGLAVRDISDTKIIWNTKHEDQIGRTLSFGVAFEQNVGFRDAAVHLYWTTWKRIERQHLFGLELRMSNGALRFGKNRDGLTAGVGIELWRLMFDYAFVTLDLENSHRISCSFSFK